MILSRLRFVRFQVRRKNKNAPNLGHPALVQLQAVRDPRSLPIMQITLQVTEEIRREAESRGLAIIDFVEMLIDKGMAEMLGRPVVNSAIERIRALRAAPASRG
jgi:hypothetical protein